MVFIVNGLVVFGWFWPPKTLHKSFGLSAVPNPCSLWATDLQCDWIMVAQIQVTVIHSELSCPFGDDPPNHTTLDWRSRLIPALLWTQGMPWVPWSISIKASRALLQVLVPGSPCILDGWCCRTGAQWRQAEAGPSVFGTFLRGIGSHWFTEFTGKSLPLLQQFAEMVIFHGGNNVLTVNHHGGGSRNLPCILWEKVPFLVLLARSVMKAQRSALLGFHCSIVATKNEPGTATGVPSNGSGYREVLWWLWQPHEMS